MPLTVVCNLRLHADCEGPTLIPYIADLQRTPAESHTLNSLGFCVITL